MSLTRNDARAVPAPLWRALPLVQISYLAVAALAIVPRVIGLGRFLTVDEIDHWIGRVAQFLAAIQAGDLAGTAITAHPGVTTMWLGSLGQLAYQSAVRLALVSSDSFATKLAFLQLPVALVNAGAVVLGYYLLRRLLPPAVALSAALLWAADPFVIGYSRVLHVDALAGTWITISVLAACAYYQHSPSRWLLILSGCSAGLALLSKSPAAVVVPLVAMVALTSRPPLPALSSLALWAGCCALTIAVLWPAVVVAPLSVLDLLRSGVEDNAAVPHSNGNFFLGQSDPMPGPLFYPAALALRTTPWALVGLLLLIVAVRRFEPPARRDLAVLAALVLALVVGLSLFPKKHNRYLEPAFPAVDILAGAGLIGLMEGSRRSWLAPGACAALGIAGALNAAFWHPYGIAAFNQLLGGAPAGAQTFLIGWGEGLEQAADWLNRQPNIDGTLVATTLKEPLGYYLRPGTHVILPQKDIPADTSYMVVYVRNVQDAPPLWPFDQFYGRVAPVHVVEIHGVPYAWIYQVAPPLARPTSAIFGDALRLRGYALDPLKEQPGAFRLRLFWQTQRANTTDYAAFVHLIGPNGERYGQIDPQIPTSRVGAERFLTTELPLQLPQGAPPGAYRLVVGVYDPASGRRLALAEHPAADPALDGPDAAILTEFSR